MGHVTDECRAQICNFTCRNCKGCHTSFNRECPKFIEKCAQLDARCPKNNLVFYPTKEPWSWAMKVMNHIQEQEDRLDTRYQNWGTGIHTGPNALPMNPLYPQRTQPHHDIPQ